MTSEESISEENPLERLLNEFSELISTLQDEKDSIDRKQIAEHQRSPFASLRQSITRFFYNPSEIKADKIRALKDIKAKIEKGYFNTHNYRTYLNETYIGDPRICKSKTFAGLFNRTERLLDKTGDILYQEAERAKFSTELTEIKTGTISHSHREL